MFHVSCLPQPLKLDAYAAQNTKNLESPEGSYLFSLDQHGDIVNAVRCFDDTDEVLREYWHLGPVMLEKIGLHWERGGGK